MSYIWLVFTTTRFWDMLSSIQDSCPSILKALALSDACSVGSAAPECKASEGVDDELWMERLGITASRKFWSSWSALFIQKVWCKESCNIFEKDHDSRFPKVLVVWSLNCDYLYLIMKTCLLGKAGGRMEVQCSTGQCFDELFAPYFHVDVMNCQHCDLHVIYFHGKYWRNIANVSVDSTGHRYRDLIVFVSSSTLYLLPSRLKIIPNRHRLCTLH